MTKGKGYLLPSGDASEDELACCLVFYPARDEYRRALMGSLDYLATWIAWERDSEKRGQDAAASWKLANIQTWECCSMGFCDDLQTNLESILAAITALECCGDQDLTDGDQYTDPIVDGVGDVPQNIIDAGYADDAADWDGFDDYKCMISHLAVDHVETFFREISPHISDAGIVFGGIGLVGVLLGAILVVVGLPISGGIIVALGASAGIWNWITTYGRSAVDDIADEIATNHDALVCAIYNGDGVADSVSDFNDKVDELFSATDAIAIKAIGFEPQLKAMYAGRYDQEDIAASLEDKGYALIGYNCLTCNGYEVVVELDFLISGESPQTAQRAVWGDIWTCPTNSYNLNARTIEPAYFKWGANNILAKEGLGPLDGDSFYVEYMEFDWWAAAECLQHGKVFANTAWTPDDFDHEVTGTYSKAFGTPEEVTASGYQIGMYSPIQTGPTQPINMGHVTRLLIAGHIAAGS